MRADERNEKEGRERETEGETERDNVAFYLGTAIYPRLRATGMPRRKLGKCKVQGCQESQEGWNECYLCVKHGSTCRCRYHTKQRKHKRAKIQSAIKEAKVSQPCPPRSRRQRRPSLEDDVDFEMNFQEADQEADPVDALSLEESSYYNILRVSEKWTQVESDCVGFPLMTIIHSAVHLDEKQFVHVYRICRSFGEENKEFFLPDCACEYSASLNALLSGGYDSETLSLPVLMESFDVGEACCHARSHCCPSSSSMIFS